MSVGVTRWGNGADRFLFDRGWRGWTTASKPSVVDQTAHARLQEAIDRQLKAIDDARLVAYRPESIEMEVLSVADEDYRRALNEYRNRSSAAERLY